MTHRQSVLSEGYQSSGKIANLAKQSSLRVIAAGADAGIKMMAY